MKKKLSSKLCEETNCNNKGYAWDKITPIKKFFVCRKHTIDAQTKWCNCKKLEDKDK